MKTQATTMRKDISSAFVLDKTKLTRILDVMEKRFKELDENILQMFKVTLKDKEVITTGSVDELFNLDNSIKNPIVELAIAGSKDDDLRCKVSFDSSKSSNIMIFVNTSDSRYTSRFFAEVEEQVERTFTRSWIHKVTVPSVIISLALLIGLIAIILVVASPPSSTQVGGYMLSQEEMTTLAKRAKEISTTEDKVNFLFELQSRQLSRSIERMNSGLIIHWGDILNLRNLLISLPILVILCAIAYLRNYAYPRAVFRWGDYEDHYASLVSMRKTIWTVVIGALLVGILGNLFVYALSLH